MLVDPVAHVGGADPLRPPRLGLVVAAPGGRGVPVVVHVVVVEDHRGRDDGQQPAHRGLGPGLPVQDAVLGEVRDLVAGRFGRVAALLDERRAWPARVVGVDLVADQQQQVGPAARAASRRRSAAQATSASGPCSCSSRCARRELSRRGRTGSSAIRQEPKTSRSGRPGSRRPEHARRELRVRLRPADGAVQGDLVLVLGPRRAGHRSPPARSGARRPRTSAPGGPGSPTWQARSVSTQIVASVSPT